MSDFTLTDAQAVADVIRRAAAEHVLPYFRAPDRLAIREKTGPNDLVTAADMACEQALTAALTRFLPGSLVVGEEAVADDSAVLDRLGGDTPVWIIDPVDGTMNFARGQQAFAVIVALAVSDETIAGWIYDPCGQRMSLAVKGAGCFTESTRILPPPGDNAALPLAEVRGAVSSRFCKPEVGKHLRQQVKGLGSSVTLGSAGQEYLHLLDGDLHASLYHRLMPWDHAAGVLMYQEAGGYVALADDESPYRPLAACRSGAPLLNAVNRETWSALRAHLLGDAAV